MAPCSAQAYLLCTMKTPKPSKERIVELPRFAVKRHRVPGSLTTWALDELSRKKREALLWQALKEALGSDFALVKKHYAVRHLGDVSVIEATGRVCVIFEESNMSKDKTKCYHCEDGVMQGTHGREQPCYHCGGGATRSSTKADEFSKMLEPYVLVVHQNVLYFGRRMLAGMGEVVLRDAWMVWAGPSGVEDVYEDVQHFLNNYAEPWKLEAVGRPTWRTQLMGPCVVYLVTEEQAAKWIACRDRMSGKGGLK